RPDERDQWQEGQRRITDLRLELDRPPWMVRLLREDGASLSLGRVIRWRPIGERSPHEWRREGAILMEKTHGIHDIRGGVGIAALNKLLGGIMVERGAVVAVLRRGEAGDADLDALGDSQRDDGKRQAENENLDAATIGPAPAGRTGAHGGQQQ